MYDLNGQRAVGESYKKAAPTLHFRFSFSSFSIKQNFRTLTSIAALEKDS
jgi:hypothetical protein